MGSRDLPADASPGGRENVVYRLASRMRSRELLSHGELARRCRPMLKVIEETHRASDQLRRTVRNLLPADVSPTLMPAAELVIDQAGEDLRKHLFEVFSDELDRAVAAERARDAAQYDCVRCGDGTRGRRLVPGVGWLCRAHLEAQEGGS